MESRSPELKINGTLKYVKKHPIPQQTNQKQNNAPSTIIVDRAPYHKRIIAGRITLRVNRAIFGDCLFEGVIKLSV